MLSRIGTLAGLLTLLLGCLFFGGGATRTPQLSAGTPLNLNPSVWKLSYEDWGQGASAAAPSPSIGLKFTGQLILGNTHQHKVPAQIRISSLTGSLDPQRLETIRTQLEKTFSFDTETGQLVLDAHDPSLELTPVMILNRFKLAFFAPLSAVKSPSWQIQTTDWKSPIRYQTQLQENSQGWSWVSQLKSLPSGHDQLRQLSGTRRFTFRGPRAILNEISLDLSESWGTQSFPLAQNHITLRAHRTAYLPSIISLPSFPQEDLVRLNRAQTIEDPAFTPRPEDFAQNSLQGQSWEEVRTALVTYAQQSSPSALMDPTLYTKIRALLILQPETAQGLAELLEHAQPEDGIFQAITAALAAIGNAACQEALVNLMEQASQEPLRLDHLLIATAALKEPNPATLSFLQALSQSPELHRSQMADAALASLGHTALAKDYPSVRALHAYLLTKLEKAREPRAQAIALSNLGNLGANEQLLVASSYIASTQDQVRESAIYSLRWVHTLAAQKLLITLLETRRHQSDAMVAARAMFFQAPTQEIIRAQIQVLETSSQETLTLQLLQNLAHMMPADPALIRSSIEWQAQHGLSVKVMDTARSLLLSYQEAS